MSSSGITGGEMLFFAFCKEYPHLSSVDVTGDRIMPCINLCMRQPHVNVPRSQQFTNSPFARRYPQLNIGQPTIPYFFLFILSLIYSFLDLDCRRWFYSIPELFI